jgi:hypothetical protein
MKTTESMKPIITTAMANGLATGLNGPLLGLNGRVAVMIRTMEVPD